ncbi:MAG: ABC transporter permease, partial [Siphonobacter aquaeclarae]|nr:ABC transporter permease [Siphonobacter aquaeclarae]
MAYLSKRGITRTTGFPMFRNYLKIAFRNLLKNRGYSFINILGLAVGLASSILILLWVVDEFSYDQFHPKKERIYRVLRNFKESEGKVWTSSSQGGLLGNYLRKSIPEIKYVAMAGWETPIPLATGSKAMKKSVLVVEPDFVNIFGFKAVKGSFQTAFRDTKSILLTESAARSYFGDKDPINQIIRFNGQHDLK